MSQSNENTTVKAAMVVLQDGNGNPIPISPEVMSTTVIFTDGVTLEERAASYISADNTAQLVDLIVDDNTGVASKGYVETIISTHNSDNTAHSNLQYSAGTGLTLSNNTFSLTSHSLWGNTFDGTSDITGNISIRSNSTAKLELYNNSYQISKTYSRPALYDDWRINFYGQSMADKASSIISKVNSTYSSISLIAEQHLDDQFLRESASLTLLINNVDGTSYATCPTPPLLDVSDKIATTDWVYNNKTHNAWFGLFNNDVPPRGSLEFPEATSYTKLYFFGSTSDSSNPVEDERYGLIQSQIRTNGEVGFTFRLASNNTTSLIDKGIDIECSTNGAFHIYLEAETMPNLTNVYSLGGASNLWTQLYASTSTISTSDERYKSGISSIPNSLLDAWSKISWYQFQFSDAVKEKGNKARTHTGLIAQRIKVILESNNIDPFNYGFLCYDSWESEDYDNGTSEHYHKDAGDLYSLRYEECFAIEAAYQRRRADRLEAMIQSLAADVAELKAQKS